MGSTQPGRLDNSSWLSPYSVVYCRQFVVPAGLPTWSSPRPRRCCRVARKARWEAGHVAITPPDTGLRAFRHLWPLVPWSSACRCVLPKGSIRQIQPHFGTLAKLSSIDPPTGTLWSGRSRLGPVGMARHGAERLAKGPRPYQAIARNTIFKPAVIAPPPVAAPKVRVVPR